MESKGTWFALKSDLSVWLNQIQPIGPTCVCRFNLVVEAIDESRELDVQFANAGASHGSTLLLVSRTAKQDIVANIALHLPHVSRVSFEDVDGIEVDLALVLLGQFVQGGNLPPEWRSGIAAEDENDRPNRPETCQSYSRFVFKILDYEIRGGAAGIQRAPACLRPHRLERKEEVSGHRHSRHHLSECLWRLMHGPVNVADEADPQAEESCTYTDKPALRLLRDGHGILFYLVGLPISR
jgi:hypothetical protein